MKKGFTLVELLFTAAIFAAIVATASGIFIFSFQAQRKILAHQELLDQTSYLMEYMSRQLRMAKKDLSGDCLTGLDIGGPKYNYGTNSARNKIRFLKHDREKNQDFCQEFLLVGTQLKYRKSSDQTAEKLPPIEEALALTSENLKVNYFKIAPAGWSQEDFEQPRVTFSLEIESKRKVKGPLPKIKIQTTISQRDLDVIY